VQHLLPEPDDESPPIPPAIGLREQWETTRRHLSADQLRLISQSFSRFARRAPRKLAQYEVRIPRITMSPLYEPCSVAEAMSERRRM
jgi:hypothetical protein